MNKIHNFFAATVMLGLALPNLSHAQVPMTQTVNYTNYHEIKNIPINKRISSKKPKNIIFMIGDGMGAAQIYAAMSANKGKLNFELCPITGFHKSYSAEDYITDSAAGATAFSIGKKTYNAAIGVDKDSIPQKTILELAEEKGLATGLVATSSITHATPASFIAHQKSRKMHEEIAADFLKTDVDIFIGGGKEFFQNRKIDKRNLLTELQNKGYQVITDTISTVIKSDKTKIAALLANDGMPKYSEGRGDMLMLGSQKAVEILNKNKKGFFLMIEGSQIDWASHDNNLQYLVEETLDFDKVIGEMLEFAAQDGETLVIITADHETGGLSLVGGDLQTGKVEGRYSTDYHTGVMIPVFAFGAGAENFSGIYENTAIYDKMIKLLGIGK
jgi:alkaline phosphatase